MGGMTPVSHGVSFMGKEVKYSMFPHGVIIATEIHNSIVNGNIFYDFVS